MAGGFLDEVRARLDERLVVGADPLAEELAAAPGVAAVVLYGSRLLPSLAKADSERDYFVLVDSLAAYHGPSAHALANAVLPPSVYHPAVGGARCKVSVTSLAQLARETTPRARDLHHLGRFSKPLGLAWARDGAARERVLGAQLAALVTLTPLARGLCARRFTVEEHMLALLGLSYLGEPRVAEPTKVRAIFDAERDHHLALGELLLRAEGVAAPRGGWFAQGEPTVERQRAMALVRRSRRRALMRWPKYVCTFDGWLDYALAKVARHASPVELPARARRHPLVFGWPALLALRKRGLLR